MIDLSPKQYRARWVFPVDRDPIPDGVVQVENGLIVAVDQFQSNNSYSALTDLGDVAIVPGLVNAHTHLEFSHLSQPLGHAGISFTDWVRKIVGERRTAAEAGKAKSESIIKGLVESFQSGVWCVGDIATTPVHIGDYQLAKFKELDSAIQNMTTVIFHEQLGRAADQFQEKLEQVQSLFDSASDLAQQSKPSKEFDSTNAIAAVSPHAPYSVHPELLHSLCQLASKADAPVAMHLAETEAERELLENQTGDFVELLQDFGVWDKSTFLPPQTITDILRQLSQAPKALVIHGNYLRSDEIEFIASAGDRFSVVYCPRTHRYFDHAYYPMRSFIKAKINVAIGTDSRASNPDLSLYEELKVVYQTFIDLRPIEILKLGTLNGAKALGLDDRLGSISPGKMASLSIIRPNGAIHGNASFDWLFDKNSKCEPLVV